MSYVDCKQFGSLARKEICENQRVLDWPIKLIRLVRITLQNIRGLVLVQGEVPRDLPFTEESSKEIPHPHCYLIC